MKPIKNWDSVQAAGERKSLPAGGYVLKINGARVETSPGGWEMLVVAFDIVSGEYAGFYRKRFDADTRANRKWPNGGIFRIMLPVDRDEPDAYTRKAGRVKSFTNAVEMSNPGYVWSWNEESLRGKMVGGLFGREEFETNDGKRAWSTKMRFACSVERINSGDFRIPEDRPLDNGPEDFASIPDTMDEGMPF